MAKPNWPSDPPPPPAGLGVPPATRPATANATRPAISAISITFCSVLDWSVPARFSRVSPITAIAAQIAEEFLPSRRMISEA
jgi:hypothetical protein